MYSDLMPFSLATCNLQKLQDIQGIVNYRGGGGGGLGALYFLKGFYLGVFLKFSQNSPSREVFGENGQGQYLGIGFNSEIWGRDWIWVGRDKARLFRNEG